MPDININIVVKDLKHGKRPIIVSAAPAGEMPLILTGHFQDLDALIRAAWMQVLTRKPKTVKVAGEKKVAEADAPEEAEDAETTEAPAPEAEALTVIEGDVPPVESPETEWDKLEDPDDRDAPSA